MAGESFGRQIYAQNWAILPFNSKPCALSLGKGPSWNSTQIL